MNNQDHELLTGITNNLENVSRETYREAAVAAARLLAELMTYQQATNNVYGTRRGRVSDEERRTTIKQYNEKYDEVMKLVIVGIMKPF